MNESVWLLADGGLSGPPTAAATYHQSGPRQISNWRAGAPGFGKTRGFFGTVASLERPGARNRTAWRCQFGSRHFVVATDGKRQSESVRSTRTGFQASDVTDPRETPA